MKVMKFGGTSVGSAKGLESLKRIVEAQKGPVIVVVSALSGVTDKLISASMAAEAGDVIFRSLYEEIKERHSITISDMFPDKEQRGRIETLHAPVFEELKNLLEGIFMLGVIPEKTGSQIAGIGERLSSVIVAELVRDAVLFNSMDFIKTRKIAGKTVLDDAVTMPLVSRTFNNFGATAIVPGFISRDSSTGDFTTLGRGGSDYTASIIAAAVGADSLEIWTDVDGFMTADPRIVKDSKVIDSLDFDEAMELCHFGAKVLYAPSLYPVYPNNIPIYVKNTFNPDFKGTEIKRVDNRDSAPVTGITSVDKICLLTLSGPSLAGIVGIDSRLFAALSRKETSAFLVTQSSSETGISVGVTENTVEKACAAVEEEFAREIEAGAMNRVKIERSLASVAVVGPTLKHSDGMGSSIFASLAKIGVNVLACAQGSSEHNISIIIRSSDLKPALKIMHDRFFLPEKNVLNLFVCGVGTVGGELIRQIAAQKEVLSREQSLRINVLGISRSSKSLFNQDGIDITNYRETLENTGIPMSAEDLVKEVISMGAPDSVFVDCTSSKDIATLYGKLLESGISVVAANKWAASSDYENYYELKTLAENNGARFLYETNVGAGLPIIKTIRDLCSTGDRIEKIEAVVSGTLNFIFNTVSSDLSFSMVVRKAKELGYTEPDPRSDLSLTDVIRKITILTREAGYRVNMEDVEVTSLLPDEAFEGSVEDFWKKIVRYDDDFEQRRAQLEKENKRLRFIVKMEKGKCKASLEEVSEDHPFYNLQGTENSVMITTERYHDIPMVISGYGAGASVTAAGVFTDILNTIN